MRKIISMNFLKRYATILPALAMMISDAIEADSGSPSTHPISITPLPVGMVVDSVAINSNGVGLIGGGNAGGGQPAYAALISSSGRAISIAGLPTMGNIYGVAINSNGMGIIGGGFFGGSYPAYAAIISSSGNAEPITPLPASGVINSVAINSNGIGFIGGQEGSAAYAALISSGHATPITPLPANGIINSVAMNANGMGLIGGQEGSAAYAALISSGHATPITPLPANGVINSVAINANGMGLIGGQEGSAAYAAILSSESATLITGLPASGAINGVAINANGMGLIGGNGFSDGLPVPYAAILSSSGSATPIMGLPVNGVIASVAINSNGMGLVGGESVVSDNQPIAYAAIISSSGRATSFTHLPSNDVIKGVAITSNGLGLIGGGDLFGSQPAYAAILYLLSHIPTESLKGNNLAFANYINENSPEDAFYFVPALFDGTWVAALESAAPTRNAFSMYTGTNNLFYLSNSLSTHMRSQRAMQSRKALRDTSLQTAMRWNSETLLAATTIPRQPTHTTDVQQAHDQEKQSYSIWFEGIGALASQKAQSQTPGFQPSIAGAILAIDGKGGDRVRLGGGGSYLYTHIHEKEGAGSSRINQEDLFVYATWETSHFYADGSLLGGLFQTDQERKIHMTGFAFTSSSHPNGWQLVPHGEVGYNYALCKSSFELRFNPFVMLDWANTWQKGYKEKGEGPFNAGQKKSHASLLRTEAGLRIYETLLFDAWNLIFQETAGYVNTQVYNAGKVQAFLVGAPGSFTVETLASSQNLGLAQFEVVFAPHRALYPSSSLFYQGEFGKQYQSHQVGLELAWNF